jgi:hypothetical protein
MTQGLSHRTNAEAEREEEGAKKQQATVRDRIVEAREKGMRSAG